MKLAKKLRRAKASPATQQPEVPTQGRSIASYFALVFFAMAVILIVCGASLFVLQASGQERQGVAKVQVGAEGLAVRLRDMVEFYSGLMMRVAKDRDIAESFINEDGPALRRHEKRLENLLPGAMQVRLLPVGYEEIETGSKPRLSFASLEMLRTAEKSDKVTAFEVHRFGARQRIIAVATKVVYPGQLEPAGIIHLAVSADTLQRRVDEISEYGGRVEVQQSQASGQPLMLAVNSAGADADGAPDGILPVPGSIWQIAYWRLSGNGAGQSDMTLFAGMLAMVLVLTGVVLVVQMRRLQQALRNDLASIVNVVDGVASGKVIRSRPARLREVWNTLELVSRRGCEILGRSAGPAGKPREGVAAGVSEAPTVAEVLGEETELTSSLLPRAISVSMEPAKSVAMPNEIFRAYDIRGVVGKSLTSEIVYDLGRAIGSLAYDQGQQTVITGRDGRHSSGELNDALCRGLQDSGRDVIDLGIVPTPLVYFATHYLGSNSGVVVTGSHNPPEYNGLKIVLNGETLSEAGIQGLHERSESGNLLQGDGTWQEQDLIPDYIGRIVDDVRLAKTMKVVVDCGNGAASDLAPQLFRTLGCEVIDLFCEVDGDFPNHHPDPSDPDNLQSLILEVQAQGADIGLAFDGDGDRLGVVDGDGNIIWPDRLLMVLAADVLSRQPGSDIIYDVKCSRYLASEILAHGGRPLMWKTGHSILKAKLKETGALLAGEFSGHIIFKERWFGFDDALYAAARLLEILSVDARSPTEVFAELPQGVMTPELKVSMEEGRPHEIMRQLMSHANLPGAKVTTLDGLRAEFEVGWGLVRASNTGPALVFRFEAENEAGLVQIQQVFRGLLARVAPDLELPFS